MAPAGVLALPLADRQALVPMAAGYLILMSALGFGLRRLYRPGPSGRGEPPDHAQTTPPGPAPQATPPGPAPRVTPPGPAPRVTPPGPASGTGWAALRQVADTVVGGYLLLMAVVIAYYFGVARVGPGFLGSAVTGTALLLALAAPVFAALSWLADRRRRS
jgi:Family of unknown function (DUF6256)